MARSTKTGTATDEARAAEILTFLIADVRGYTSFTQAHGDEAAARLAATFAEIAREGVEAHGGEVIELRGDEALAVFGSARRALRAAAELQLAFVDETERRPAIPLRVGIGLDAGEAVPVEGGYRGGALNLAARLCSSAGPGEVIASRGVVHLARAVEGLRFVDGDALLLKGLEEPVPVVWVMHEGTEQGDLAARLEGARPAEVPVRPSHPVPAELDPTSPMAGADRERDARRLRWWWRLARRGDGRLVLIVGERGMGKTRLAAEPANLAGQDAALVLYATSASGSGAVEDAIRAATGADGPVLLVLDDLDIADAADLEAVTSLLSSVVGRPLLVVATGRDGESATLAPLTRAAGDVVHLEALGPEAVADVIRPYARGGTAAPLAAMLEASGGVPLEVHRLASEWARGEAARRLGDAAARAAASRSDLRSLEAEVASNVIDLQLVRERSELHGDLSREIAIDGTRTSPYKGLASFDVADAEVFFGRERLVAEMVGRLVGSPLVGVVGPSGSGKSSAVRAGLLPAIAGGVLPGSETWLRVILRPGPYPLRALDRAVWDSLPDAMRARLEGAELPLRALRGDLGDGERVVVVVDQFEELFTQCHDEDEREAFVRALVEAAEDPRANAVVIVAVRADLYGRCAAHPALAELLGASHVLVGPMTSGEYARAITGPARRSGLQVEPALVDALVAEVIHEPGALPLLSSALLELWQRRRGRTIPLEAYRLTGGVRGAVGRIAEEAYGRLDDDGQAFARAVMLRLAGPGEGETLVRRRVPLAELDIERDEVARVVEVLTEARLVTVSEGSIEVAHEALLREWPRLQGWLEEDRVGQRLHAHMIETAKEWDSVGRDPAELYRGARLASALDWTAEHSLALNELERRFLAESRAASEAETESQRHTNRRLRGLLAGVAVFLALALVAGGFALVQSGKAGQAAQEAEARRLGAQAVVEDELDLSLLLARQGFALDDSEDTRSTLLASLLKAPGAIGVLPGTGDRVLLIRESANGEVFATTDNTGGVAIYDTEALELDRIVRFEEQYYFDISPDGAILAGATFEDDREILAFVDIASGEIERIPLPEGGGFAAFGNPVAFHPDGSHIVSLECRPCEEGAPSVLVRRDPADGAELDVRPVPPVDLDVRRISYSPDGDQLVIEGFGPQGGRIVFLDAETLEAEDTLDSEVLSADLAPDGRTLAVGREDGSVVLIDLATGKEEELQGRHNAPVTGVGFSPDGSTLLSTGDDRDVIVWDVKTRTLREILHGHAGRVFGPAFDADGSTAFTVGLDGKVIAWDLSGERRIGRAVTIGDGRRLDTESATVSLVMAAPADGSALAVTSAEGNVLAVDPASGEVRWEADPWSDERIEQLRADDPGFADAINGWVTEMAFSPDGTLLAVGGENQEVVLYDPATGAELRRWNASRHAWVNGLSFASDGSLLTANDDGRVVVWDPNVGSQVRELRLFDEPNNADEYQGAPFSARLDPDGKRLAVGVGIVGEPMSVAVYDLETGERLWTQEGDEFIAVSAWSPDSSVVATGGWQDGSLTLREAETGKQVLEPVNASAGFVLTVGYTPDGSTIVTGATDGTVRLWDADTLKQIGATLPHPDNLWTPAVVVDGDHVLSVSSIGQLWRWDLDPDRWAEQACLVANRSLTEAEWELFLPGRAYEPACHA